MADSIKGLERVNLSIYNGRIEINTDYDNNISIQGKIVVLTFYGTIQKQLGTNETSIFTIPTKYCPTKTIQGMCMDLDAQRVMELTASPSGYISMIHRGTPPSVGNTVIGFATWAIA